MNIFSMLKKYPTTDKQQRDENFVSQCLAVLLTEFPKYKTYLVDKLLKIQIEADGSVRREEEYTTKIGGKKARLDLVLEDKNNFIMIEVKVRSSENLYEGDDKEILGQIELYENIKGLPTNKAISIFLLTLVQIEAHKTAYIYYNPAENNKLWYELANITKEYSASTSDGSAEKYLLNAFYGFLKEERMTGFQGFNQDIREMENMVNSLAEHRNLIKHEIGHKLKGYDPMEQKLVYGRDGIFFKIQKGQNIGIFVGIWYSDRDYVFKFDSANGPQLMVFVEIPPNHPQWGKFIDSAPYNKASALFKKEKRKYQLLLAHEDLAKFLSSNNQTDSIVSFYSDCVDALIESGVIDELKTY